jgi:simple sugar transport system substrate-binding protein
VGVVASLPVLSGVAEILTEQGAGASTYARNSDHPFFAKHPKYHFVMVNHVTTNSFFTATIYGCQDACALTGSSFQWTGSTDSVVSEMVSAMDSAIASSAKGIGVALIDNTAFNKPTNTALDVGIPVISYNADVGPGFVNNRLAYVGQSNLTAGAAVATRILPHVKSGDKVGGIIATPGTGNIQPRINGARPVFEKAGINFVEVGTSATEGSPEYNKVVAWYAANKDAKFMMAVDSGDSNAVATFIVSNKLQKKLKGSGWDTGVPVIDAVASGSLILTIDQQAYLQGFDTIMQLFLYNISGGLMKPTNTDTGTAVVTKGLAGPYKRKTRWEGTTAKEGVPKPPASIPF